MDDEIKHLRTTDAVTELAEGRCAPAPGSEDGRRTWPKWRSEARRLQQQLDELKEQPASHEQTVLYLLSVAETMLKAADMLVNMRQEQASPVGKEMLTTGGTPPNHH